MTAFLFYVVITGYLSVGLYKSHPDYVPVDGWHSIGAVRTLVFLFGWVIWPIMLVRTWRAQKRDDAWVEPTTGAGPQKSYLLQGAFKTDPPKFTPPQRRRQRKSPEVGI